MKADADLWIVEKRRGREREQCLETDCSRAPGLEISGAPL